MSSTDRTVSRSSAQEADMKAAGNAGPKKTWFFQRGDGKLIVTEEREAWDILTNRSEWRRKDFTPLGTSDGTTYERVMKKKLVALKELGADTEKIRARLSRLEEEAQKLEDEVEIEGTKEMKTRLDKVRAAVERLTEEYEEKMQTYQDGVRNAVSEATQAELEVAKANGFEQPKNMNVIAMDDRAGQLMGQHPFFR